MVAKLIARGISARDIREFTLYQAFSVLYALNEEDEFRVVLAGGKIEEPPKELTIQDLFAMGG